MNDVIVSVIMSAYNAANFISEAIESVLVQTCTSFELLIVDDCSIDDTASVVNSYNDKRVLLFQNEERKGLTKNLNFLLSKARGKFIARLDADDVCMPDRLEKQVFFLEHNMATVVCSYAKVFGSSDRILKTPVNQDFLAATMLFSNHIIHSSVMFRNDYDIRYDEYFSKSQDYDLWDRILYSGGTIATIPSVLVLFRTHNKQISFISHEDQVSFSSQIRSRKLNRLGIKLNEDKTKVVDTFLYSDKCVSIDDLLFLISFFDDIFQQNQKVHIYNTKSLNKVLRFQYTKLLLEVPTITSKLSINQYFYLLCKSSILLLMKQIAYRLVK